MSRDTVRQVAVGVGAAAAIAGAAWGSGAFGGTKIAEAADGALASDATLLAPATPAFAIWTAIYALLALVAIVQALPCRREDDRYRAIAWWLLASMLLNAAWIAVVQAGWIAASVVVLATIVGTLAVVATRLNKQPSAPIVDVLATEASTGLYLGWSAVATAANLAAALGDVNTGLAIALIVAVGLSAIAAVWRLKGRALAVSVAIAVTWGSAWIGVARLAEPANNAVAATAFVAATAVAVTGGLRLRTNVAAQRA